MLGVGLATRLPGSHHREMRARSVVLHPLRDSESGQSLVEYVLIVAGVALACMAATLFLSGRINGLFSSIGNDPGIFSPPSVQSPVPTTPELAVPDTVEDCLNGGWQNYPQFDDEIACVEFVNNGAP